MKPSRPAAAVVVAGAAAAVFAGATSAASSTAHRSPQVPVVAFLDTGVRPTHQEFDYRGPTSASDQLTAWWDFTADRKENVVLPKPGDTWDTAVPEPYDLHGHGTGVAAMGVGLNRGGVKTPSAAPGYRFAMAKVLSDSGSGQARLGDAIRWAVHTVHADVVNISIGSPVPVPSAVVADTFDALDEARAAGVLVVVGNGNGWGNLGARPGEPGWGMLYSSSTSVLAVGAAGATALLVTTDPEVTAPYIVRTASIEADDAYAELGGTSFASPYVAGFGARLVQAARAVRRPADPGRLERIIAHTARDTALPPTFEGYGEVHPGQLPTALGHVRAGTLPTRPDPDVSGLYVERVAGELRRAWSDRLRKPLRARSSGSSRGSTR